MEDSIKMLSDRRALVILEVTSAVTALIQLLHSYSFQGPDGERFWAAMDELFVETQKLLSSLDSARVGRGHCKIGRRLPQLAQPKSHLYELNVHLEDKFVELVRFTPKEFEDLHNDLESVLHETRDLKLVFTEEENETRRKRRYKYSSRERLFHFLMLLKSYPKYTNGAQQTRLSRSGVFVDFKWLRHRLHQHAVRTGGAWGIRRSGRRSGKGPGGSSWTRSTRSCMFECNYISFTLNQMRLGGGRGRGPDDIAAHRPAAAI